MTTHRVSLAVSLTIATLGLPAHAQQPGAWPERPIRLIVPYPPGGGIDVIGRPIMAKLAERLGQSIVFDNRGGGGAVIGTALAAKAAPDGHTLLISLNALTIGASILPKLPYDVLTDLAPITQLISTCQVLVVHPSLPVQSVKDLIGLARSQPGKLNYGTQGPANSSHFAMELLKRMAGVDLVHIPYKGGGPSQTALLSGEVKVMFLPASFGTPLIQSGKVRALGVSSLKRSAALPDIPTVAESGLPGFESDGWWGMFAPTGTPRAIVERLHREFHAIVHEREMREFLVGRSAEPVGSTPEQFGRMLRAELAKWRKLVQEAGLKAD